MTKVTLFAQVIQKNEANYNLTKNLAFPHAMEGKFCSKLFADRLR